MHQISSRESCDDLNVIEIYQNALNQRLQNFSNSKYSNPSLGIKVVSNNNNENCTKKSAPQTKSKIAKKTDKKINPKIDCTREPLKSTNKQTNTKKKNTQEAKLYGTVIQKVDYPQKRTPTKPKLPITNTSNPSPKIGKSPNAFKGTSIKSSIKNSINQNDKSTQDKSKKSKNTENNDNLQVLATKYSKFLQERINSHQKCELQIMADEKNKKSVSFQQQANENKDNAKRPALYQSNSYSIERPEVKENNNLNKDISNQIPAVKPKGNIDNKVKTKNQCSPVISNRKSKKDDLISTPQKRQEDDFELLSESESENDEINDFHSIEPKIPPKPIEHLNYSQSKKKVSKTSASKSTEINKKEEKSDNQFEELLKKKNELDARINSTISLQNHKEIKHFQQSSYEDTESYKVTDDDDLINNSLVKKIEQIQNSISSSPIPNTNSSIKNAPKIESNKSEAEKTKSLETSSNLNQDDPLNFVPKKRLFDMSGSDSDYEESFKTENAPEDKNVELNPISAKKDPPKSPHVTWDISNCPPIRPKVSNKFGINKSFSFINYDEMNGYSEEADANQLNNNQEIDFNSPVNFSKAMKLPKDFFYEVNNNCNDDDNTFVYDNYENYENEEEDKSDSIPNYSRILSILNKKLDGSRYTEVVNIMNKYKVKHFCLLISLPHQNVEALYLLRSDLCYARLIWGEGLSKVYRDDVLKFFTINIASRRFEQMKTTEFVCDVDAFTLD